VVEYPPSPCLSRKDTYSFVQEASTPRHDNRTEATVADLGIVRPPGRVSRPVALEDFALPARRPPAWMCWAFVASDVIVAYCTLYVVLEGLSLGGREFLALRVTVLSVLAAFGFGLLWTGTFRALGLYARLPTHATPIEVHRIILGCSIATLPTSSFLVLQGQTFTMVSALVFWAGSVGATVGVRGAVRAVAAKLSGLRRRHILIVGSGPRAKTLHADLCLLGGLTPVFVGFVDDGQQAIDPTIRSKLIGALQDLESVLMRDVVDEVLIALPIKSCYQAIQDVIHTCARLGVQSTYLSDIFPPSFGRVCRGNHPFPARTVKVVQDDVRLYIKRGIDILGSVVGLLLLSPVFAGIAIAIKLTSPGPALFAQRRYGWGKRLFTMYKFRTMVANAEMLHGALESQNEADGPVFKIAQDPRVTSLGRLLRKSSLDELPQLWNVLKGEMSLVGPRPLATRDVDRFTEGWLMRRFSMRPGMTCLWQVAGRSDLGFADWVTLDLKYIDTWSLTLDAVILMRTLPAVLSGRGAT
jgi:exopolysaccharide biosynthesis polyprenyl glycosylphosphotransferase